MANNTKRVTLTHNDWEQLSGGNATVKLQPLQSDVMVYYTDSDTAPDATANKDSFVLHQMKNYYTLTTALKVYAKKADIDNNKCDIIYVTE